MEYLDFLRKKMAVSAEDKENIYTVTILHTVDERRTDALPMKAYMCGECVGKVGKEFRR